MSHQMLEQILWFVNFMMVLEAFYMLAPLFKGKPFASRRGCLVAATKYFVTLIINGLMHNYPMLVWMAIGFIKETIGYIKLRDLKEGFKI